METVPVNAFESSSVMDTVDRDLNELLVAQGINVWGQTQEVLERQALHELEIFNKDDNEEGEILDGDDEVECEKQNESKTCTDERSKVTKRTNETSSLNIASYLKRQEELRKRQVHKRSLLVSERSKAAADVISKRQVKRKRRRKTSEARETKVAKVSIETENNNEEFENRSGSEYVPSEDSDYEIEFGARSTKTKRKKAENVKTGKVCDDGALKCYQERLDKYYERLSKVGENDTNIEHSDDLIEIRQEFKIRERIWSKLYGYQQESLEWFWELHRKCMGGLLGDEMGLGKTVQVIAFLDALSSSRVISNYGKYTGLGPTIIISPSTVVHQWVKHFHDWSPEFRVAVLHQSGSYTGNKLDLIKEIFKEKGIIVTTYQSVLKYQGVLTELDWHYVILDEGHKIRNPNAKISVAIKRFRTPHRILLTGSPMQNNLQELWSLFDFTNPGMLGTLTVFMEHFAGPIMQGGYSNANPMQEALALSMATALKNMITPFLLRRAKADVKLEISLPNKCEQVLFCSLTDEQHDLYKGYLMSDTISAILGRGGRNWFSENHTRANVLMSITTLRKICNHPDIYLNETDSDDVLPEDTSNFYKRSGKMIVVSALLKIWKRQKHRILLFTQSRAMISIFETFLTQQGYRYLKMDGSTAVASRQPLIYKFNNDTSYDVFLLTTRVGGLGVNLTGANRVIIYDPDWNPATDTQARERAWRIGQEKEVTIYRLLSAGTIEEKMYQRQVWKQLLSNKVLLDPKTQRFFKSSDLHDLFSLQERNDSNPETANIFQNSRISIQEKLKKKKSTFSKDKVKKMRELAARIAKNMSSQQKDPELQELQEERMKKLCEKQKLKQLTPLELLHHNREKVAIVDEPTNKIDDCETEVSFTKALVISEQTSDIYHKAKTDRNRINEATDEYTAITQVFKKRNDKKTRIDTSGCFEGEKIDNLVKLETKKVKKTKSDTEQGDYVLEKLFNRKGVQTALQHDKIVQVGSAQNSIKIRSEAQNRTDLAIAALRKSRFNQWRW